MKFSNHRGLGTSGITIIILTASVLIGAGIIAIPIYNMHEDMRVFSEQPVIERTVYGTVTKNEYTECVFVIDDKRITTSETPCLYKEGEKVNTQLHQNGYRIIIVDEVKP